MKLLVKDFAELCGVSVRTLHYYDEIGLLKPCQVDKFTSYRYYDENSLLRMQEILFYRELDFSLKSISEILSSPDYDKERALQQQKKLLILKKERLERLICAIDSAGKGLDIMSAFNNSEFEKYKDEVREKWGSTDAYKDYSEKSKGYSEDKLNALGSGIDSIMGEFSQCMNDGNTPSSEKAQSLCVKLQSYITHNLYNCTKEILSGLGQMYVFDERFRKNINKHGEGTAEYINEAIKVYCR